MHKSIVFLIVMLASLCDACRDAARNQTAVATSGNPDRGAFSITRYGCGSCHTIPGIVGAHGLVGPPLAGIGSRIYVAGILSNQPTNLERWVQDPRSINDKTVMPSLGVTAEDATDIAAYLYSLK